MLIETTTQRVLAHLCKWPTKAFSVRELARELKIAHPSVATSVHELAELEYIKIGRVGRSSQIKVNLDNEDFKRLRIILNLLSLQELTKFLIDAYNSPTAIILFGSYSRGEDIERSDVDIVIITPLEKKLDVSKFRIELNRDIQIFTFKSFKEIHSNLRTNVLNGIKLYGVIDGKL